MRPTMSEAKRLLVAKHKLCAWLAYLVERDGCPKGIDRAELQEALADAGHQRAAQSLSDPEEKIETVELTPEQILEMEG